MSALSQVLSDRTQSFSATEQATARSNIGAVGEAPTDGGAYARKAGAWAAIPDSIADAASKSYVDSAVADKVTEAPEDGKLYARYNKTWSSVSESFQALSNTIAQVGAAIPTKTSQLTNDGDGTTGSTLVKSADVTAIVKVTALPDEPDANTLYIIVEDEATTTSETEEA